MKTSLPHRKPTCAVALDCNLEELRRLNDLESLRPFIIKEKCFPPHTSPSANTPITFDELKKLARAWKLNERRNFWKTHSTQDALVEVLLKYVEENRISIGNDPLPMNIKSESGPATSVQQSYINPTPPQIEKRSSAPTNVKFNPTFRCGRTNIVKFYCGHKLQNKIRNPDDILTRSRYFQFPNTETHLSTMVDNWRIEDFVSPQTHSNQHHRATSPTHGNGNGNGTNHVTVSPSTVETLPPIDPSQPEVNKQDDTSSTVIESASDAERIEKQRILSIHLLNFSHSQDAHGNLKIPFARKTTETFLNVAESTDVDCIANCAMAIANICCRRDVRYQMIELNALHKFTAMLPNLLSKNSQMACALFFYYMSCDSEIEDRIWNSGFKAFQRTLSSDDFTLRMITLQCLSNLIPSSERLRVVELIVSSIHQLYRDFGNVTWNHDVFSILLNLTTFQNCHHTLVEADMLDIISVASGELDREDIQAGKLLVQILNNFLYSPDLAEDLVHADYARIYIDLLQIDDTEIMEICVHAYLIMSSIEGFIPSIVDSDIVHIIGSLVGGSLPITDRIAEDAAGYFANISKPTVKGSDQRVRDGAAHAMLRLVNLYPKNAIIQRAAIGGIRDLLTSSYNCSLLIEDFLPSLLTMAQNQRDNLEVIHCIYNFCCSDLCIDQLVSREIELKILEFLATSYGKFSIKSALLKVLVLLADKGDVIMKILNRGLIKALLDTVSRAAYDEGVWLDVSRLLIVVIYHQPTLTDTQQLGVVQLLQTIGGVKGASEAVIANCAVVLAYLSYTIPDFSMVDPIIRAILNISESDTVMNAASTVLYNVACNEKDCLMLLQDGMLHINIMIKMMRNGSARVQQNVAEAMRLLCIIPRCNELLLKNDLLSDFIVIALLRTNNVEVKKVCSEAFYNMLCHRATRKRLLQGDLWWAMMRLSKSDSGSVRLVCARAVFNLASEPENIPSLRENFVLSFIKEIIYDPDGHEYMEIFIQVIHNILTYADQHNALNPTEILNVIQICVRGLFASVDVSTCRWLCYLLTKIASLSTIPSAINEFIHLDVISSMLNSKPIWARDLECRRHLAFFLAILTSNQPFLVAIPFVELLPILNIISLGNVDVNTSFAKLLRMDENLAEHVSNVILNYISANLLEAMTIIQLPFLIPLINIALAPSPQQSADMERSISPLTSVFLRILAFVSQTLVLESLREETLPIVSDMITILPVGTLLNKHLYVEPKTRNHAMHVVYWLSLSPILGKELLRHGVIRFLDTLLADAKLKTLSTLLEFISLIPRVLASQPTLVDTLCTAKGLDTLLQHLHQIAVEAAGDSFKQRYAISSSDIMSNGTVVLYYISNCELLSAEGISPKSALALVTLISNATKDLTIQHLLKHVIGRVLDKAKSKETFDPIYIQTILTELNDHDRISDQDIASFVASKQLTFVCEYTSLPLAKVSDGTKIGLDMDQDLNVEDLWSPIVVNQRKRLEFSSSAETILPSSEKSPISGDILSQEIASPYQLTPFVKIITTFPFLKEPSSISQEELAKRKTSMDNQETSSNRGDASPTDRRDSTDSRGSRGRLGSSDREKKKKGTSGDTTSTRSPQVSNRKGNSHSFSSPLPSNRNQESN